MMVLAVTLHNIPEGMAVGVMYAGFLAGNAQITAASTMLYVVVEELIPEMSQGKYSNVGTLFFTSGVFYYFLTEQVKALVQTMADAFPGGVLVFGAANRTAVKMIAKTWLKSAKIQDVGAYFAVSDAPKEIGAWHSRLRVTSRGYMLGYDYLKDPAVSGFFRFLARIGDGVMKMQIVRIKFIGR